MDGLEGGQRPGPLSPSLNPALLGWGPDASDVMKKISPKNSLNMTRSSLEYMCVIRMVMVVRTPSRIWSRGLQTRVRARDHQTPSPKQVSHLYCDGSRHG